MDREELRRVLDAEGISADRYSLYGGLSDDCLCLHERHGEWIVYYSERGERWNEQVFNSEEEGCRRLLYLLRTDSAYRDR